MLLLTRQSLAAIAARRWKIQYPRSRQKELARLRALGSFPDPDAVDQIVGNTSWTSPGRCDECGDQEGPRVEVGEVPDYESSTCRLCQGCAIRAQALFDLE